MKTLFLTLVLSIFTILNANAQGMSFNPELDDLMSPDEIATEAGFPRTEYPTHVLSVDDVYNIEGVRIFQEYPIVVVVNKKDYGYEAQTAKVYENGELTYEWKVSTGREQWEVAKSGRFYFTATPRGYFYPYNLIRRHWSGTWDALMEYSVFFNGGVALHATTPDHYRLLGQRASGGCVRLRKENAQYLFNRIREVGKGLVPIVKRNGTLARDRKGRIIRGIRWNTLVVVEEK